MNEQKNRARASGTFKVNPDEDETWNHVSDGDDSTFTGYDSVREPSSAIASYRSVPDQEGNEIGEIILSVTPFYAESGGQVGDTGVLVVDGEEIVVLDTQRVGSRIIHRVDRIPAQPEAPVDARVDVERREAIVRHHSATHLVHAALREVLGPHVAQKGSLVAPDHLRFDFSHFERVGAEELRQIEWRVNDVIQSNIGLIEERDVPLQAAMDRGARALFGEKYGETVRVITFDPKFSVELCGGVHVGATGEIGLLTFRSEGSVAAGVRRIEAVGGKAALSYVHTQIDELSRVRSQFKSLQRPTDEELADLLVRARTMERELDTLRLRAQEVKLDAILREAVDASGIRLIVGELSQLDMPGLRSVAEKMAEKMGPGSVGVLGAADVDSSKVYLACAVSADLISDRHLDAGKIVGTLAKMVGGGGGGRPDLATAGGRQPEKLGDALASVERVVHETLA
jgi:alanyl-tRNA synthetase